MKVALVCDWLDGVGGAEKVLQEFHNLYPEAPIYTSIYRPKKIDWFRDADVRTGWLNAMPAASRKFIPFLRNAYFNRLDLTEYDLIISSSGAEAKGAKKRADAMHICYLHAPTQYYWQKYHDYMKYPGFGVLDPLARLVLRLTVGRLRKVDFEFAQRPDYIVTASSYTQAEIKKYYKRESTVIFPPVDVAKFANDKKRTIRRGFVTTSRQVPWKRLDLAVKACVELGEPLTLIGGGSEHKKLRQLASGHEDIIKFLPTMDAKGLKSVLCQSRGYIFPSLEPFGIAPIEALATGTPVIAFGKGGAIDYIDDGKNGILFRQQTVESLRTAIEKFNKSKFDSKTVAKSAKRFSDDNFRKVFLAFVNGKIKP